MVATPEPVQRKAGNRPGHPGLDGKNHTGRTRVTFETETGKKKITLLPPALSLKEVRFLWRTSRGRSASKRRSGGLPTAPDPIDFNEQAPARTVCTKRRSRLYVVYIYKDISDATGRRISSGVLGWD